MLPISKIYFASVNKIVSFGNVHFSHMGDTFIWILYSRTLCKNTFWKLPIFRFVDYWYYTKINTTTRAIYRSNSVSSARSSRTQIWQRPPTRRHAHTLIILVVDLDTLFHLRISRSLYMALIASDRLPTVRNIPTAFYWLSWRSDEDVYEVGDILVILIYVTFSG